MKLKKIVARSARLLVVAGAGIWMAAALGCHRHESTSGINESAVKPGPASEPMAEAKPPLMPVPPNATKAARDAVVQAAPVPPPLEAPVKALPRLEALPAKAPKMVEVASAPMPEPLYLLENQTSPEQGVARDQRAEPGIASPAARGIRERVRKGGMRASAEGGVEGGVREAVASGFAGGVATVGPPQNYDPQAYERIQENELKRTLEDPLSTFSIDVDTASYGNVRRFVTQEHRLPPKDAVRIEELINYFNYDYPNPTGADPFSITTEVSTAPWNPAHRLVHIGVQGKRIPTADLPANNLVFLIDVSGSMSPNNRLPLLKTAFRLLVDQLRPQDRVAIVVYAGAAGLVLPSTSGVDKPRILEAIENLHAGGSTAGAEGIRLAYDVASQHFLPRGNNRVILATDGDFNVGVSSDEELVSLIEKQRKTGVFLTLLGVGTDNYQDAKMEKLADKGNGQVHYIDDILEAEKVLVKQLGGTLLTIAKDVKIQVEFNPAYAEAYRLVGYENRVLAHRDFNDDNKDAGELGAGHSVTALYEVIPAGMASEKPALKVDPLKYQVKAPTPAADEGELLTVKLRYKPPTSDVSRLLTRTLSWKPVSLEKASASLRFASAVAEFGMLLRDSAMKGSASYDALLARAAAARGNDEDGYRADFVQMARRARVLASESASKGTAIVR